MQTITERLEKNKVRLQEIIASKEKLPTTGIQISSSCSTSTIPVTSSPPSDSTRSQSTLNLDYFNLYLKTGIFIELIPQILMIGLLYMTKQ